MRHYTLVIFLLATACGGSGPSAEQSSGNSNITPPTGTDNLLCGQTITLNHQSFATRQFDQNNDGCLNHQEYTQAQKLTNAAHTFLCPDGELPLEDVKQDITTSEISFDLQEYDLDHNNCMSTEETETAKSFISDELLQQAERRVAAEITGTSGIVFDQVAITGNAEFINIDQQKRAQLHHNLDQGRYQITFSTHNEQGLSSYPARVLMFYHQDNAQQASNTGPALLFTIPEAGQFTLNCRYQQLQHDCVIGEAENQLNIDYSHSFPSLALPKAMWLNFWLCQSLTGSCAVNSSASAAVSWN